VEALDIADRLRQEGIQAARDNITRLSQLSTELMQRAGNLLQNGKEQSPSGESQIGNRGTAELEGEK
jgi:hypothetical protein